MTAVAWTAASTRSDEFGASRGDLKLSENGLSESLFWIASSTLCVYNRTDPEDPAQTASDWQVMLNRQTSRNVFTPRCAGALLGIVLMLLSAAGGMRQASRFTEEIQETESAACQAVVRTEETRTPSRGGMREVMRDLPRAVAVLRCQERAGHRDALGHSLPNGLSAPLRC
jgi:hypothetical protein